MSATTEKLLEDIQLTKKAIEACKNEGNDAGVVHLSQVLKEFEKRLSVATVALNEGKSLLKD